MSGSKAKTARRRLSLMTGAALAAACLAAPAGALAQTVVVIGDGQTMNGGVDYSASSSVDFTIESGGLWLNTANSEFSPGADDMTIEADGHWITGSQGGVETLEVDFLGGADTLVNDGVIVVAPRSVWNDLNEQVLQREDRTLHEGELRLENLERFEHSGLILLGGFANDFVHRGTDGRYDDILSMPGTTWVGDGGEVVFDIDLNLSGQTGCDAALRDGDGDLPAADCVAIVGGETEGTTYVAVNAVFAGDRGAYNPGGTVLVDVSGGTSAAGHFVLGPNSGDYSSAFGGVVDKGIFFYPLIYDEATSQHKLFGLASGNAMQFPLLAQAAHGLWRLSTGSSMERQADLRGGPDGWSAGGVWLRASAEAAQRDVSYSTAALDATFDFDNSFSQDSYTITGGADLLSGGDEAGGYAVGLMAGYAHADVDFEASPNSATLDGFTGGAYASFVSGGFFLDAALNANKLILKNDIPDLDLFPGGTILDTDLLSVGAQAEAGWRIAMGAAFIEPAAAVSYVRTRYDEMEVPADDPARPRLYVNFDDPVSLRAGLGARLGIDQDHGGFSAQYSLLGRVWNEFEDETGVTIANPGPDAVLADEFTGAMTELGFGASLYSGNGMVSGFLNVGGEWADDYQATSATAGIRVRW